MQTACLARLFLSWPLRPLIGYGIIKFWTGQFRHTGLGMDVGREGRKEGRERKKKI